ncbi:flavin-containing monooxygenase [Desertibaculum subflavum]|uniref:flavin-containing monooxygenase n=1 Tax=Desertibaculum subflavum TaxID=2268458 RepID=UPI000E6750D1
MSSAPAAAPKAARSDLRFAVIGAGMSGILTAIELKKRGLGNFTIYEKADRLGGTWRDNTYPGLSCDVPSHVYAYSFELNPEWSHRFSPGAEIQNYFEGVARKYGVDRDIRFNSEIVRAEYQGGRWQLETRDGHRDTVDFVIAATGVLHKPVHPAIEGLDSFAGPCFHSARWDHSATLDGQRVGIIGTGSTAIQIVPAIADRVAKLSLFQRTAQWVLPLPNPAYSEGEKAMYRDKPELLQQSYVHWTRRFVDTFARAVVGDQDEMAKIEQACRDNLEQNVHDPDLRERLRPNYRAACKRLIMSDTFYPAMQKPNVDLVTESIERIEPAGVRTRDGRLHALDVLVLATGFDGHNFVRPMQVVGEGGRELDQAWAQANEAYRSVAVPGFPNFFMLVGPNSPIGNFSVIMISEIQIAYILQLVDLVRSGKCDAVAPKAAATARFNADLRAAMQGTVWVSGCRSWYLDKNGNPALWPWSFERFRQEMQAPDLSEFELT